MKKYGTHPECAEPLTVGDSVITKSGKLGTVRIIDDSSEKNYIVEIEGIQGAYDRREITKQ